MQKKRLMLIIPESMFEDLKKKSESKTLSVPEYIRHALNVYLEKLEDIEKLEDKNEEIV